MNYLKEQDRDSIFSQRIQEILGPMLEIAFFQNPDKSVALIKSGIKFGLIKKGKLYLINQTNTLQEFKIDSSLLSSSSEPDRILRAATESYWRVSGKINKN